MRRLLWLVALASGGGPPSRIGVSRVRARARSTLRARGTPLSPPHPRPRRCCVEASRRRRAESWYAQLAAGGKEQVFGCCLTVARCACVCVGAFAQGRIVTSRRGFYPQVIEALDGTLREPPPAPTHLFPRRAVREPRVGSAQPQAGRELQFLHPAGARTAPARAAAACLTPSSVRWAAPHPPIHRSRALATASSTRSRSAWPSRTSNATWTCTTRRSRSA